MSLSNRLAAATAPLAERLRASTAGRWFAAQSPRDQRLLALLAVFLGAVSIWLLLWLPVQDALSVAERRHADAVDDRLWVLEHQDEAARAAARRGDGGGGRSGQALLSTVAESARRSGLTLNRFQPEGSDALSVFLEDVPFGDLVIWLERLAQEEGIVVRQATVDASGRSGRVRARIVLG